MSHSADVDNKGGCAYVVTGSIKEISIPSPQFWCEPKSALGKQSSKKKSWVATKETIQSLRKSLPALV